jgi:hypothetical protein
MNVNARIHESATFAQLSPSALNYCGAAGMERGLERASEIAGEFATENTVHALTCRALRGSWQLTEAPASTSRE